MSCTSVERDMGKSTIRPMNTIHAIAMIAHGRLYKALCEYTHKARKASIWAYETPERERPRFKRVLPAPDPARGDGRPVRNVVRDNGDGEDGGDRGGAGREGEQAE